MNAILTLLKREPAVVIAVINAALVLAVSFGLRLAPEQTAAIDALLVVIAGIVVRSQVTPAP